MPLLTADHIFTPDLWLENYVLEVAEEGIILNLRPRKRGEKVQRLGQYLVPGFINAHTHLELSHLKDEIPQGRGMAGFAWEVVKSRSMEDVFPLSKREKAMEKALQDAWEAGVQGFGDIANEGSSQEIKGQWESRMTFHTFIELIGLNGKMAAKILEKGQELQAGFGKGSLTLHAPYSVSPQLRDLVYSLPGPFSIHLLESKEEKEVFEKGEGAMVDFFLKLGIKFRAMDDKDPLEYLLKGFPKKNRSLWVHLKEASGDQLARLAGLSKSYFCLCPRSNEYIHGEGPKVDKFLPYADRICLGTDSLASNHDLSIWEEVKWIGDRFPELDLHKIISWGTCRGAEALGFDGLGTFRRGSSPGVLVLDGKDCQRLF